MITCPNVKLNLGLNVLRKRQDGYHDIETLFIPYFGFHDTLEIIPSEGFNIEIDNCSWDPADDITAKAYRLMKEKYGIPPVAIRLRKGSPVGAGLGGGSADGAFAIRMMNDMFSLGLCTQELVSLSKALGSDCAFFIHNKAMIGEGRGDILSPADIDLSGHEIKVIIPEGISVSTADAYKGIVPKIPRKSIRQILSQPIGTWKDCLVNDFEKTVFEKYPVLADRKQELYEEGAIYASMSGSGSSLFGIF